MKWYLAALKKYAEFNGRARRKEYWMFFLFAVLFSVVIGFITGILEAMLNTKLGFIPTIYALALFIPSISVAVRRMHDTNRSGWWVIVPIAGFIFLFLEGEQEENRFGPNPKLASA